MHQESPVYVRCEGALSRPGFENLRVKESKRISAFMQTIAYRGKPDLIERN
jgi:5-enolpyruvylshikimate-3-phosphate synthase